MQTYVAHYHSPQRAVAERARGLFEFQSDARAGTKANAHDAPVRMLEVFGSAALSWTIDKIERKKVARPYVDGQLEFDFRTPDPASKRKPSNGYR